MLHILCKSYISNLIYYSFSIYLLFSLKSIIIKESGKRRAVYLLIFLANYYCVSKSKTERMVTMQAKDFFWRYFQQTGGIEAYLIYKEMLEEEERMSLKVVPGEE